MEVTLSQSLGATAARSFTAPVAVAFGKQQWSSAFHWWIYLYNGSSSSAFCLHILRISFGEWKLSPFHSRGCSFIRICGFPSETCFPTISTAKVFCCGSHARLIADAARHWIWYMKVRTVGQPFARWCEYNSLHMAVPCCAMKVSVLSVAMAVGGMKWGFRRMFSSIQKQKGLKVIFLSCLGVRVKMRKICKHHPTSFFTGPVGRWHRHLLKVYDFLV